MFNFLNKLFNSSGESTPDFKTMLNQGAVIIDVRTPAEFKGGHVKGSINVPLDSIASAVNTLKAKKTTVIAVCRSGARSSAAVDYLRKQGIEAVNGGPWNALKAQI